MRTLPCLVALRAAYPDARIDWLVERKAAEVLHGRAELDEVLEFPREALSADLRSGRLLPFLRRCRGFARDLAARRYDLVLDFHAILKSGLLSFATRAPIRISYARPFAKEASAVFATERAALFPEKLSRYERNAGLLEYLGIEPPAGIGRWIEPSLEARVQMRDRIARSADVGADFVLIHPGSSPGTPYKRYRASGYAAFAKRLARERGLRALVVRGRDPGEARLAEAIVEASHGAAVFAPACENLAQLAALTVCARLFVGSDSGPLHIASAVGTPAIQLIGPTDPVENAPGGDVPSRQLRVDVPCSPCRRGCAAANCMMALPHEWIFEAACELLDATAAAPTLRVVSAAAPTTWVAAS